MKNLILILNVGILSFAATAQTTPADDAVTISGPKWTIRAPLHYRPMQPDEFFKFKGTYDLSNGKTLTLFDRNGILLAKIEGERSHHIVNTAQNTFVAKDQELQIRLDPQENGDVTGEVLVAVTPNMPTNVGLAAQKFMVVALR